MENTVVGVYESYAQAEGAVNELQTAGFSRNDIQFASEGGGEVQTSSEGDTGSGVGHFFRSLFGMEEHREHGQIYSEALRRGNCVLTVNAASEELRDRAVDIMNRHNPIDIDERAAHWRSQGWTGYDENAPTQIDTQITQTRAMNTGQRQATESHEEARIPVIEETLRVGKRAVQRGGIRVYQHMTERPVHETVELREEHLNVERQPVDQPATQADLAAFKDGSVEMHEMGEESVISKSARVVEEVVVNRDTTQRQEEINDTLRKTDVQIEQIGAESSMDDSDFRRHWQSAYGTSGGRYEDYDSAYRYGSTLAGTGRFKNYQWSDVEPDVRSDWEARHPESTWEKVKDAVRYGAERVTGRH